MAQLVYAISKDQGNQYQTTGFNNNYPYQQEALPDLLTNGWRVVNTVGGSDFILVIIEKPDS